MTTAAVQIDNSTYARFRALILERSGLYFVDNRRHDLEAGLLRALARSHCPNLEAYYVHLAQKDTEGPEWEQLICQVTVGETYFFRDQSQFQALQQHILPELIAHKRDRTRSLRIWSAGCATGEEPYSIAILLRELLPDIDDWQIAILGTDINRESLARARAGLYGEWSFREEGWTRLRPRYFSPQGKYWQISRDVRHMVWFAYLNLMEDRFPALANNTVAFDLVLCRNVTIYFPGELTRRVADQFYETLVEGGWLVVGHSEPSLVTYARFEVRNFPGAVLYRKGQQPDLGNLAWLEALEKPRRAATALPGAPARPRTAAFLLEEADLFADAPARPPASELYAQAAALLDQALLSTRSTPPVGAPPAAPLQKPGTPPQSAPAPGAPGNGGGPAQETGSGAGARGARAEPLPPTPADLCAAAAACLEKNDTAAALQRLHRALELDPEHASAAYLVAKIWADAGAWADARRWGERAARQDPLRPEVHFLLGLVHHQEGHVDDALAEMKRVVYLERSAALGHFWLATLYRALGDPERAQRSLQTAVRLLEALPAEAPLPWSDGMSAGRLLLATRQQLAEGEENGYKG